jgi:hypothetical protein
MTNFPSRVVVMGAGAVTGAILMFAGALSAAPAPITTSAASTPTPTYQGRYDAILTPSVEVRPPAPAGPGPQKDAAEPTTQPSAPTSSPTPTTQPVPTTRAPQPTPRPVPAPRPAATTPAPSPPVVNQEPVRPATVTGRCNGLGVAANVARACSVITREFPEIRVIGGRQSRPGNPTSCHPRGLALDFMIRDRALGDRVAAYIRENRRTLDATPVILWQVPAHYDHVHVSFSPCRG